jgi:integrase
MSDSDLPKKDRGPKGDGSFEKKYADSDPDHKNAPIAWRGVLPIGEGNKPKKTKWYPTQVLAAAEKRQLTPYKEPEAVVDVHTVRECLDAYFASNPNLTVNTRKEYEKKARKYLRELNDIPIRDLTFLILAGHFEDMRVRELSRSILNQSKSVLSMAIKHVLLLGWVEYNVTNNITLFRSKAAAVGAHSKPERDLLLAECKGDTYEVFFRLRLLFALRPAESTGVRFSDVDHASSKVFVHGQIQFLDDIGLTYRDGLKRGDGRWIHLDPETLRLIAALEADREEADTPALSPKELKRLEAAKVALAAAIVIGVVPPGGEYTSPPDDLITVRPNGLPLRSEFAGGLWRKLQTKAGVEYRRPYSTRHTSVSVPIANGAPILSVSLMAGHRSADFTQRVYAAGLEGPSVVEFL